MTAGWGLLWQTTALTQFLHNHLCLKEQRGQDAQELSLSFQITFMKLDEFCSL